MGKSVAARLLKRLGLHVHDSDAAIHALLSPKSEAFEEVALAFPQAWDKKTRTINRKILGDIVFHDDEAREKLESILHPHVWESQRKFILKAQRLGLRQVVLDIPLLFETGAETKCTEIVCVTAPPYLQRLRVLRRPNMDEQKFQAILRRQMPDQLKRRLSDHVVQTGLGYADTFKRLQKALRL